MGGWVSLLLKKKYAKSREFIEGSVKGDIRDVKFASGIKNINLVFFLGDMSWPSRKEHWTQTLVFLFSRVWVRVTL